MPIPKNKHQISITVDKDVYEDLLKLSDEIGIPISKIARNLLYAGLDDAKVLQRLGFVKAYKTFKGLSKLVNEKLFWSGQGSKYLPDENEDNSIGG